MPYLWNLFQHEEKQKEFSTAKFRMLIDKAYNTKSTYEKGVVWEDVATDMLEHICGWKITGRRIHAESQEIDISVVNVSLDDELWQLGAYILVECKN